MLISYSLIGLLGAIIGALGMYFGSINLRLQKKERLALKQRQEQLDQSYSEMASHFARNVTVLEKMTNEYRRLHRQAHCRQSQWLPNQLFYQNEVENETVTVHDGSVMNVEPPCDYSNSRSEPLSPK